LLVEIGHIAAGDAEIRRGMSHWYEKTAICSLVDNAAERFGSKEALYFEGKRWTFAQIKEDVDRCARGLIQLGVKPGKT
tara:strand:+ start:600 stop:836 length:237 start_codon:yes stop_codon:yes gene_type:complete